MRVRKFTNKGFSLYEILIAVGILAFVAVLAAPQVQKVSFNAKLEAERANIALIQNAKEAYSADNSGIELSNASDLLVYLPDQQMPQSPFGTEYKNLTDLTKPVISGFADVPAPQENNFVAITKLQASGYNALDGGSSVPGVIAVSVPTPTPTTVIVTPTPTIPTPVPNNNPFVALSVNPSSVYRGQTVNLLATGSDSDGDILSYNFTASGESVQSGLLNTVGLQFPSPGSQPLGVTVSDGRGGLASASASVDILNRIPTVSLVQTLTNTFRGNSVTFIAIGLDGDNDPITYQFKINDDTPLAARAGSILNKAFDNLGTQKVLVTVNDGFGGIASAEAEVTVTNRNPSVVSLSVSPINIQEGEAATFAAVGFDPDGDSLAYSYRVGNTGTWTDYTDSASYTQSFDTAGTYTVFVKAVDSNGAESNVAYNGEEANVAQASLTVANASVDLTVLVNPSDYGIGQGSGSYVKGSTASASVSPHYGYQFKDWDDNRGASNPLLVDMQSPLTVTANLERQVFKVTLSLETPELGFYFSIDQWVEARVQILGSTGNMLHDSKVTSYAGTRSSSSEVLGIWIPYGETITVRPWGSSNLSHFNTRWNDASGQRLQKITGYQPWSETSTIYNYLSDRQYTITGDLDLGLVRSGTPLLLDFSGDGVPDLLAGADWGRTSVRRPSVDKAHYRFFDLDGNGSRPWEWVGPKDGLLVYLPGLEGTPNADHLFGSRTFGKDWKHGYEALQTLDKDKDGVLSGEELNDVGLWVDANSDAIAQAGEIKTSKELGVTEVSVAYAEDKIGNVHNNKGAKVDGKMVAVWDWISYAYPELSKENEIAQLDWSNQAPPKEFFSVDAQDPRLEKIEMLPNGTLRVYKINDQLYVRSTAFLDEKGERIMDLVFPAEATDEGILVWAVQGLSNSLMASGEDYYGLTLEGKSYGLWTAKLVSGNIATLFSK